MIFLHAFNIVCGRGQGGFILKEENFASALLKMNFTAREGIFEKIFAPNVIMRADLNSRKLFYPNQIQGGDRNNFFDKSHRENLVVFECVNRLLDKGYKPEDIELERAWQLGHIQKSGRADICVSSNGETLFIIECKTAGAKFNQELNNMHSDGGQLFSYWQQEQSCQWLMLYSSEFKDDKLTFSAKSIKCDEKIYREAHTVEDKFKIWSERCDKKFFDDVIFHDMTRAYKIGIKPLIKSTLQDFDKNYPIVNKFEEILRHNQVSDKENAFNRLIALFIAKLVDESHTPDDKEVNFQFKDGSDTRETFQDRLQKLYSDGMKKFMGEDIFYLPEDYPDKLFKNFSDEENHSNQIRDLKENFRKLKFYTNNAFAFVDVQNEKLFRLNSKILLEVVDMLKNYRIIGSGDLQTLGDLFEQLLDKGFKQDEGQFFTPVPIARFIWDSLPLDKIISDEPPKIIDYACGAGHFLTEGFKAVNDCYARKDSPPPPFWERDKLFGVEKDYRLARVSKISLFMHGADEGKIKFGDGLEDYPDENILPATFDILVANPPFSVKGFKLHLKLANKLNVLDKISKDGSEIETLFAERISQLVKPRGFAAVILPSSILNKEGKSFIAARESLLKSFYLRAIVQLEGKTFGATSTSTVILFLERFDEPPRMTADYEDVAESILSGKTLGRRFSREIFDGYLIRTGKALDDLSDADRERLIYFGLTFKQRTLIISAPKDNKEQEKFLGYGWSNAKGNEGIVHKKLGGVLYINDNRAADNTLAAVVRAACLGQKLERPDLKKYYHYATLADLIDFDADNFTKKIKLSELSTEELTSTREFPTTKLGDVCEINSATLDPTATPEKFFHYVDISAVDATTNKINFANVVTGAEAPSRARRLANEGDVLISTVRPNLKSFAQVKDAPPDTLYSTGFAVLSTKNPSVITNEFIFRLFMDDTLLMEQIKVHMPKGSYPSINQSDLKGFHILLPPLAVQKRIVEEFAALDAQIDSIDDTIKQLDSDIKAKFAALFEEEKNFERLDKIADEIIQGTSPKSEFYNDTGEGIPFYQGKKDFGERYLNQPTMWTTEAIKVSVKDDILMSVRAPVGDVNLNPFDEICIGRGLAAIRINERTTRDYVFHWLHFHNDEISGHKGSTFDSISGNEIRTIKLPLPPLKLQEEFALYVTNCEELKKSARKRREELLKAREGLVAKYFR